MTTRPGFNEVTLNGDIIEVDGESNAEHLANIYDIVVGLQQGKRVEYRSAARGAADWKASFEVEDAGPDPKPPFVVGEPALVVGIEMQVDPLRVISWSDVITIELKPK